MAFNAQSREAVLFGGDLNGASYSNLSYVLSFRGTNSGSWIQLSPLGTVPSGRAGNRGIWDYKNSRMIVYSGYASSGFPDQWELRFFR